MNETASYRSGVAFARSVLVGMGLLTIAAAFLMPVFRRVDGSMEPNAVMVIVAGLALAQFGIAWRTSWERAARWFALALLGQACALGLIYAPNFNVLQHYYPWDVLLRSPRGFLLLVPLAQTCLLALTLWRSRSVVEDFNWRGVSKAKLFLVIAFMLFSASNFSASVFRYTGEVVLAIWIIALNFLNLLLVTLTIPQSGIDTTLAWMRRFNSGNASRFNSKRVLPWVLAASVTGLCALLSWAVFDRVPHIPDSVGYLFQAKHFSVAKLYLPAPPVPAAFEFEKLYTDGTKWWNYGFPGWPVVLALGVRVGASWLINPLLAGLTILLCRWLLIQLYDRTLANVVVVLLAVSPWFLFMSSGFEAHPVSIVWTLLALCALEKVRQKRHVRWGLATGASMGALLLTRPLEAILVGAVVALWILSLRERPLVIKTAATAAAGAVLIGALIFPYNKAITGSATYPPHAKWADSRWYPGADRLGFGADVGNLGWPHLDPFPGHGARDILVNSNQNTYMSNFELFGWSFGSLGFVAALLLLGTWQRPDKLFLALILFVVAGHSFYWFSGGPDFGARYWYQILIPAVVLTGRGIQELQNHIFKIVANRATARRVWAFVCVASLVAMINFVPWRSVGKYHRYRGMGTDILVLAKAHQFGHSLVFVREGDFYDYPAAFVFNPATLESSETIYARDLGPAARESLAKHFPDRQVWIVGPPQYADGALTIVAGPSPASNTRAEFRAQTSDQQPAAAKVEP